MFEGITCVMLKFGWTALFRAVCKGRAQIVTLLISHGCDVNNHDKVSYL